MLDAFLRRHAMTFDAGNASLPPEVDRVVDDEFRGVLGQLGGKTFDHGLYRVYRGDELLERTDAVSEFLTETAREQVIVFASDWLGRQFAVSTDDCETGGRGVFWIEPGTAEGFEIDQPIVSFHTCILATDPEPALACKFYRRWRETHHADLAPDSCVGYKVPLFLGGEDDLPNLEIVDMGVYIRLCAQLWKQVKNLPEGTPIGRISME